MTNNAAVVAAAGCVVLAIVVLIGSGPARPVQSVSYSNDGRIWTAGLAEPLLDKDIRWIPGDSRSSQFHVRNGTDHDGRVQLSVQSENLTLARALSVSISGRSFGSCALADVAAGETMRIDAMVTMAVSAGNDTRNSSADVDLVMQWGDGTTPGCTESTGSRLDQEGAQS